MQKKVARNRRCTIQIFLEKLSAIRKRGCLRNRAQTGPGRLFECMKGSRTILNWRPQGRMNYWQPGTWKFAIRVTHVSSAAKYSLTYQKVQSSAGSTVMLA